MHHCETNTFHNVRKSKISITDLYEFMRHMHECQVRPDFFLLAVLREFFFRFRVGRTKNINKKALKMTG